MLTKADHDNILKEIASSGGATDNMLEAIQKLRDDYDEREGMLKRGEDETEQGGRKWREEYEELKRKYIDRFFKGDEKSAMAEMAEEKRETKEDVKKDGKKETFEELFTEREGT